MTVFWDVAPCSPVKVNRRFRGACCVHHQAPDGGGIHLQEQVNLRERLLLLSSEFVYPTLI
jgi:hypothetical protein